jgi:hypothetical protein
LRADPGLRSFCCAANPDAARLNVSNFGCLKKARESAPMNGATSSCMQWSAFCVFSDNGDGRDAQQRQFDKNTNRGLIRLNIREFRRNDQFGKLQGIAK